MTFFSYWKEELVEDSLWTGLTAFRGFEVDHVSEIQRIADRCIQTAEAKGLICERVSFRPWHRLADVKEWVTPVLSNLLDAALVAGNDREWMGGQHERSSIDPVAGHEGVSYAWRYLREHRRDRHYQAAQSLVQAYLRGQKPASSLLETHRLKRLRNPLTERNAESFLKTFLQGVRSYTASGTMFVLQQTDSWTEQSGSFQQLKLVACATAVRRWIDWSVQQGGSGVIVCLLMERSLWNAMMDVYPPLKQRISELRRPPKEPFRSPLQYGAHLKDSVGELLGSSPARSMNADPHDGGHPFNARRLIDAMRMGLVPPTDRGTMTIGMDAIHAWLDDRLLATKYIPETEQLLIADGVSGGYGSGKSHFLHVFRDWFHQKGWLTAWTEFDGKWCSWSDPLNWLRELVRSMPLSLWELWVKGYPSIMESDRDSHDLNRFGPMSGLFGAFYTLSNGSLTPEQSEEWAVRMQSVALADGAVWQDEELNGWKKIASPTVLSAVRSLIGRSVEQRKDDLRKAVEAIAWLCIHAGYKGIWIAIDECDQEARTLARTPELRARAQDVYQSLIQCRGTIRLTLATVPEQTNPDSFLLALKKGILQCNGRIYELPVYGSDERLMLAEQIFRYYQKGFQVDKPFNPFLVKEFDRFLLKQTEGGMDLIRLFVKWYIHFLDTAYGPKAT